MALGLPTDQRGQIMLLLVVAALAGGYFFWTKKHTPDIARITEANQQSDSLERIIASAKADIASGTLEDLRRRVEQYQGSLELMRRLVPDRNEVPTLIDDISTKAKVRGITIGKIQPQLALGWQPSRSHLSPSRARSLRRSATRPRRRRSR